MTEEPPIYHAHVKILDKELREGHWFALFMAPSGDLTWMEQPVEPTVGEELVLYIIQKNSIERGILDLLIDANAPQEVVDRFVQITARAYGQWCEQTWEEAKKDGTVH